MKILIFSLLFVTCVNSAAIKSDSEKTEVIPDVTSDLIDASDVTTEIERTKKSPANSKTICYETNVDGKSILQCADDAETSDTIPVPSVSSIASGLPALPRHSSIFPAFGNSARMGDKQYNGILMPFLDTTQSNQQNTASTTPKYVYTTESPANPAAKYADAAYSSYKKPTTASNYSPSYSQQEPHSKPESHSHQEPYSQPQPDKMIYHSSILPPIPINQGYSSSKPQTPTYQKSSTTTYSSYPQSYQASGYSQSAGQSGYAQPAGQSPYSSSLYSYSEPTYKPTQSYEGYRYYSETPSQTNSYQYTQADSSNSALADYEAARATANANAQAEYEQARAKAGYEKMKAEYDSANARAAENAQAQAAQDQARAEYENSLAEYYSAQAEQQSRAQAEAAARAQAEYQAANANYEQARMMYENSEYESARSKAPVYSPPAIHYGPPVEHTYHSPAPSVPCPTNLLFSCAPNVAPVPCQKVEYSHHAPAPVIPPVHTRPAPVQYNPYNSYRSESSKQIKRENESGATGFNPDVVTDKTPFNPNPTATGDNTQLGRQDWS